MGLNEMALVHTPEMSMANHCSWLHAKSVKACCCDSMCDTDSAMPDTILTLTDRWSDTADDQF